MLKSRKATFKPKAQPTRRPGAPPPTQSSTRPSVEPQLSTPAPETNTRNGLPSTSGTATELSPAEAIAQSEPFQPAIEKEAPVTSEPLPQRSSSPPKRKARDDVDNEPPTKRVAVVQDDASSGIQSTSQNEVPEAAKEPAISSTSSAKANVPRNLSKESTTNGEQGSIVNEPPTAAIQSDVVSETDLVPAVEHENRPSLPVESTSDNDEAETPEGRSIPYPTPPQSYNVSASPLPDGVEPESSASGNVNTTVTPTGTGPEPDVAATRLTNSVDATPSMDDTAASRNDTETTKRKKKTTKRKVQRKKKGDESSAAIDLESNEIETATAPAKTKRKRGPTKKRAKRAETPENAEDEVIDVTTIKMADLCKDMGIGKRFSKAGLIKERMMKQKLAVKEARSRIEDGNPVAGEETDQTGQSKAASPPVTGNVGLQMRVVDGHIVLNDETTQVNRQERFDPNRIQEVVEEDDFTRVITSSSFNNKTAGKPRTQQWDEIDTEMFYKGLRTWGTDFETIAKMFPHRNRRQIKMKFNKEERDNGAKVTRIMNEPRGTTNPQESLAEFQTLSGKTLEEVVDIQAEYERVQAEHDAEQAKRLQEKLDADAKKKAEIEAKTNMARDMLDEGEVPEAAKENAGRKSTARKRTVTKKKKNMHSSGGGETMEVLASIEID